jgi:probable HAF family extracellular repeat protein
MKFREPTRAAAIALLAAVLAPSGVSAHEKLTTHFGKQAYYAVKDLGTLGGTQGVAEGISNRDWVVGDANLACDQNVHAFLWQDGVMRDLGTLGGLNSSEQWPVKDDRGLIAGAAETAAVDPFGENFCGFGVPPTGLACQGFLWQDGVMSPLATLGGNNSYATGVNNRGQVVGYAENSTQDPTCMPPAVRFHIEAVLWGPKAGQIEELPPFPGDTVAGATGINDRAQVIGASGPCSNPTSRGVLWEDRTVTDLGTLGGALNTIPWAINSAGVVAGQSDLSGDTTLHAFVWTKKSGMRDLGTLPGDSASLAFGLNDGGQVVGGSCVDATFNDCRAFLWQDGKMIDVNSLVQAGSTPLYLFFGNDINARGEIAAYAFDQNNGEFHAALLIPCNDAHADVAACAESAAYVAPVDKHVSAVLPANLRRMLHRGMPFRTL